MFDHTRGARARTELGPDVENLIESHQAEDAKHLLPRVLEHHPSAARLDRVVDHS